MCGWLKSIHISATAQNSLTFFWYSTPGGWLICCFTSILYWYVLVLPQNEVFLPSPFPQPFLPSLAPLLAHGERPKWMNRATVTASSLHQSPAQVRAQRFVLARKFSQDMEQEWDWQQVTLLGSPFPSVALTVPTYWIVKLPHFMRFISQAGVLQQNKRQRLVLTKQTYRNYCLKKKLKRLVLLF